MPDAVVPRIRQRRGTRAPAGARRGGITLRCCAMTDDGARRGLEYYCVRWGRGNLAPQAGLAVCERGPDGLLAAVRVYDDVARPRP